MFTGIIKSVGRIVDVKKSRAGIAATVVAARLTGLEKGASIAVNGICLTVTTRSPRSFSFFAIPETLRKTTVGSWKEGQKVNLEKSLKFGEELGGHLVSGHIEGIGRVSALVREGKSLLLKIEASAEILSRVVTQGSVALDGVSLTIADVGESWFSVALIPYTLSHTSLRDLAIDDTVNIETDMLAQYAIKRFE